MSEVEELLSKARALRLDITRVELDGVAALAFAIAQDTVRRKGGVLTPALARDYGELSESERAGLRQGALQVLKALVLMELVDVG